MGGTADFGYDIIYGSYIVGGASSCSVQVTGVQAKANCSLWLSCNHSRADPWHVFIVYLFKDICLPYIVPALLGRHLAIGHGLASGGVVLGKCLCWFLCGMRDLGSKKHQ